MPELLNTRTGGGGDVHRPHDAFDPVGKRPVVPDVPDALGPQGPTANRYVDDGAACDTRTGPGCFLDEAQRGRLTEAFHGRVSGVERVYKDALMKCRIDELVAKDDDLPWVATVVLEVIGGHVLSAAVGAATRGLAAARATMQQAEALGVSLAERVPDTVKRAMASLSGLSESEIKAHVGLVVTKAKRMAEGQLKSARDADAKAQRKGDATYLRQLYDQASVAFQTMREGLPAVAVDTELFAFFESFDIGNHTIEMYETEIAAKVARYRKSGVEDIGVTPAGITAHGEQHRPAVEKRVVWMRYQSKSTPVLGYVSSTAGGKSEPDPVPPEFAEAALARHRATWGAEPESVKVDDSGYFWDPKRAGKAQENNPVRKATQQVQDAHDATEAGMIINAPPALSLASNDRSTP